MDQRKPPLSPKPQRSLEDRDAASDHQGHEARERMRALASKALSAPYEKVRALEDSEKGKSGKGRKPKRP